VRETDDLQVFNVGVLVLFSGPPALHRENPQFEQLRVKAVQF
jgi:hypothetical protein